MNLCSKSWISRIAFSLVTTSALTGNVLAEKAKIDFLPLEVTDGFKCSERVSNQESFEFWLGWDQTSLPDWPLNDIRRDLGRLISHKASDEPELIITIISKLESSYEAYERHHAVIDLIKLDINIKPADQIISETYVDDILRSAASLSPSAKNFVSNLILNKTIDASIDTALDMKISAANEGNADALLELTSHLEHPFVREYWGINSDITVLLAFGSLLGEFDENYCNRVKKIAREFSEGNYVQKDIVASSAWYAHLADLGDVSSAWKVAEINMIAPKSMRDNVALYDYLTIAFDAGYTPAIDGTLKYLRSDEYNPNHLPIIETFLTNAAENGHDKALNALVHFYKIGQPFGYQAVRLNQLLEKQYLSGNSEAALQLAIDLMQVQSPTDNDIKQIASYLEAAMKSDNNSTKAIAFNLLRSLPQTASEKEAS